MKPSPHKKALRQYYRAYYNDNFLRNFRFIFDKEKTFMKDGKEITYNAKNLTAYKYGKHDISQKKALNFLSTNSRARYGLLGGEITYYKTLDDFKEGKIEKRFCDRLFFDFDIDDSPEVKQLKEDFKNAHKRLDGKEHDEIIEILQDDFKELIFEKDLLYDVFNSLNNHTTPFFIFVFFLFHLLY